MPQVNVFRWRPGNGWLVFSGGGPLESEDNLSIEARMLGHTVSQGPLVYIWAASDVEAADRHMDSLRDLGARTGYLVDILSEDDETLFRQISEAGVIILGDGPRHTMLQEALVGVALRGMEEAFHRGATIYAVGASAAVLGAYSVREDKLVKGFNWLAHSIVLPGYSDEHAGQLRGWIQQYPAEYGLGIGHGAALALGPGGEIEVWGNAAITISLGQQYTPVSGSTTEE